MEFEGYRVVGSSETDNSIIYKALGNADGNLYAIKTAKGSHARLRQSAAIQRAAAHPNVVSVRACNYMRHGEPFVVMDWVDGKTLKDVIPDGSQLPLSQKLQLIGEMIAPISHAHSRGILHGDLSPLDILVLCSGENPPNLHVKITDFGAVQEPLPQDSMHPDSGRVMKPLYAAPEQLSDPYATPSEKADVYALSLCAAQLIHGETDPRAYFLNRNHPRRAFQKFFEGGLDKDPEKRVDIGGLESLFLQVLAENDGCALNLRGIAESKLRHGDFSGAYQLVRDSDFGDLKEECLKMVIALGKGNLRRHAIRNSEISELCDAVVLANPGNYSHFKRKGLLSNNLAISAAISCDPQYAIGIFRKLAGKQQLSDALLNNLGAAFAIADDAEAIPCLSASKTEQASINLGLFNLQRGNLTKACQAVDKVRGSPKADAIIEAATRVHQPTENFAWTFLVSRIAEELKAGVKPADYVFIPD